MERILYFKQQLPSLPIMIQDQRIAFTLTSCCFLLISSCDLCNLFCVPAASVASGLVSLLVCCLYAEKICQDWLLSCEPLNALRCFETCRLYTTGISSQSHPSIRVFAKDYDRYCLLWVFLTHAITVKIIDHGQSSRGDMGDAEMRTNITEYYGSYSIQRLYHQSRSVTLISNKSVMAFCRDLIKLEGLETSDEIATCQRSQSPWKPRSITKAIWLVFLISWSGTRSDTGCDLLVYCFDCMGQGPG
jgi:hypothetical protein